MIIPILESKIMIIPILEPKIMIIFYSGKSYLDNSILLGSVKKTKITNEFSWIEITQKILFKDFYIAD